MGQVIRGPWRRRRSDLRPLVESNLRRLHVHREHWAQPILDNLNRNVLAEEPANASETPIVGPATD